MLMRNDLCAPSGPSVSHKSCPFGEQHLRILVREYLEHYHRERNHQGLDNHLIETMDVPLQPPVGLGVGCHERLGGMLKYYHQAAA